MSFTFDPITNSVNNLFELFKEKGATVEALTGLLNELNRQPCDYRLFIQKALSDNYTFSEVTDLLIGAITSSNNRGRVKAVGELLKEEFARKR